MVVTKTEQKASTYTFARRVVYEGKTSKNDHTTQTPLMKVIHDNLDMNAGRHDKLRLELAKRDREGCGMTRQCSNSPLHGRVENKRILSFDMITELWDKLLLDRTKNERKYRVKVRQFEKKERENLITTQKWKARIKLVGTLVGSALTIVSVKWLPGATPEITNTVAFPNTAAGHNAYDTAVNLFNRNQKINGWISSIGQGTSQVLGDALPGLFEPSETDYRAKSQDLKQRIQYIDEDRRDSKQASQRLRRMIDEINQSKNRTLQSLISRQ